MWVEVHIYSVKDRSQAGNIWVKDIMTTQKGQSQKIHEKFMHFAKTFLQRVWGSGESAGGLHISLLEHTQKVAASSP